MKLSQIDTEIDKNTKVSNFQSKVLCIFCLGFHRLRGLESFKGSTMKKLVRLEFFDEEIIAMF